MAIMARFMCAEDTAESNLCKSGTHRYHFSHALSTSSLKSDITIERGSMAIINQLVQVYGVPKLPI